MPYRDIPANRAGFVKYSHVRGEDPGALAPGEVAVNLADQSLYVGTTGGSNEQITGVGEGTISTRTTADRIASVIPAGHVVIDADTGVSFVGNGVAYGGLPMSGDAGWALSGQPFTSGVGPDGRNLTGMDAVVWAATAASSRYAYDGNGTPVAMTKNGSYILTLEECSSFTIFHTQGSGNTVIDWGDGNQQTLSASTFGQLTHTYSTPGQFLISWTENSNPARITTQTPPKAVFKFGDAHAYDPALNSATGLAPIPKTSRTWMNTSYSGLGTADAFLFEHLRLVGVPSGSVLTLNCTRVGSVDITNADFSTYTSVSWTLPACKSLVQLPADKYPFKFKGCSSLDADGFPANGVKITTANAQQCFDGCTSLRGTRSSLAITIDPSVTALNQTFSNCNIDIEPESLSVPLQGPNAWSGCDHLGERHFTVDASGSTTIGPFQGLSGSVTLRCVSGSNIALGVGVTEDQTDLDVTLDFGANTKIKAYDMFKDTGYVPMWANGKGPNITADGGVESLEFDHTAGVAGEMLKALGRPETADFQAATLNGTLGNIADMPHLCNLSMWFNTHTSWPLGELPFGLGWMRVKGSLNGNGPFWNILTDQSRWFSTVEYDKILNSLRRDHESGLWTASPYTMNFGASKYSDAGAESRAYFTNLGYTINDGGKA